MPQRPDRQLLQADDVGTVSGHELDHLTEEGATLRRRGVAVEEVPSSHEHGHGVAYEAVRVLLADPPAFTPPYDHELAAALVRAGAEVELVTSRFRFGDVPEPEGYTRREVFYPLSSRVFGRSALRLPLKVAEHPLGLASLRRINADVLHCSGCPRPSSTRCCSARTCPRCSRRTTFSPAAPRSAADLWRRLFARFDRIVVHSESGRDTLAELGVERERLRVIPHPVFPSDPSGTTTAARCSPSG